MKARLWVLVIVIIVGLMALGIYFGWKRTGVEGRVERLFISRLSQLSGARVRVDNFQMGLGYLQLRGLSLVDEERGYALLIDQTRVTVSLLDHILGGFRSTAGVKEVLLIHPQMEIRLDRLRQSRSGAQGSPQRMGQLLPDRVIISKGTLVVTAAENDRISRLISLDGWLDGGGTEEGSLRCTGTWAGPEGNLTVSGTFQDAFRSYTLRADLQEASVPGVLGPVLSDRYTYKDSEVFLSLQAEKSQPEEEPRVEGRLILSAGELVDEQLGITLQEFTAQARLDGQDLVVEGARAVALGGQVLAQGHVWDLLQPSLDLQVEFRDLELQRFLFEVFGATGDHVPEGAIHLAGTLTGAGDDLHFVSQVSAARIEALGHRLEDLSGRLDARGTRVVLEGLTARLPWAQGSCQGELDLSSSPADLLVDWRLEEIDMAAISRKFPLGRMRGRGFVAGRMSGPAIAPQLKGGFRLEGLDGSWLPVDQVTGRFHWDNDRLSYQVESPDGRICLQGGADNLSVRATHQAVLRARQIPLRAFIDPRSQRLPDGFVGGRWMLNSTSDVATMTGQLLLEIPGRAGGRLDTYLTVSRPWDPAWTLEAAAASQGCDIGGTSFDVDIELAMDTNILQLKELRINDQLQAYGQLEHGPGGQLEGQLLCSQLDVRWPLVAFFPELGQREMSGSLSGGLTLGGTWQIPEITGELMLREGSFNRLEDISVNLPLRLEENVLRLSGVVVRHRGRSLMTLAGEITLDGNVDLLAHGEKMQASSIAPLFTGPIPDMSGFLSMALWLTGPVESLDLGGHVLWRNGVFHRAEFDELVLSLRGEQGLCYIDRFSMDSWNRRHIWARGTIPNEFLGLSTELAPEKEMDLTVGIEGDVLSVLPAITSLIAKAEGRGEATFRLGGSPGALVVGTGSCHFQEGWLEPAVFIKRLENFSGQLEIDEEHQFLHIEELSGTVEGRSLQVSNYREVPDTDLESLVIPGLGIDLGVLALETSDEGIEVNVPDLMQRGEAGQMRMSGHDLQGPLLVAGPLESPQIIGMISLNHFDFTYPPMVTSGETPLDFLAHICWDLGVMARKDVWYQNDFANLRVRNTQSQLHFTGCAGQGNLSVTGHAEADRGEVIYLDRPFQVVELELDFEGQQTFSVQEPDNRPYISGRFETTVYSESTGVATDIYLTLYTLDEETGQKLTRGRWGDFELELSSSDPSDDGHEKVLARLGYTGDYAEKAMQLLQSTLGPKLENVFLRPVLQPVERTIKRALGIDVVRLQPGLAWNLLSQEESPPGAYQSLSRRLLFPRTSLLVGKYLTDDCFLSYLGKFHTRTDESLDDRLGIVHRVGLEYRLGGGTILDLQYDYERDLTEGDKKVKVSSDKRVQITHHFPF